MGTVITPELLSQIQTKKIPKSNEKICNENKFSKKKEKPKFKEIINDIYSPYIKKKKENSDKNEIIINIQIDQENNKENEEINLNKIFFQKHKSFDLSYNFYKTFDILDTNSKFEKANEENYSEINNESLISDYADISNDFSNFNNDKKFKKKINDDKKEKKEKESKKIRDSYYNKLITKLEWDPFKKKKIVNNIYSKKINFSPIKLSDINPINKIEIDK